MGVVGSGWDGGRGVETSRGSRPIRQSEWRMEVIRGGGKFAQWKWGGWICRRRSRKGDRAREDKFTRGESEIEQGNFVEGETGRR